LSQEQSAQIEGLRTDLRARLLALRDNGEGTREQAQALHQAHREQVQALLTEEHRSRLEELRANRPEGGTPAKTETDAARKTAEPAPSRTWGSVKSGRR